MAISFTCECGKKLKVSETLAGKKVKCPDCHKVTLVSVLANGAAARSGDDDDAHLLTDEHDDSHTAHTAVKKKPVKSVGDNEHASKKVEKQTDEDEEPSSAAPQKSKKLLIAAIAAVVVCVFGAAGWALNLHKRVWPDPPPPSHGEQTPIAVPAAFEALASDEGRFKAKFPNKNNPTEMRDPRDREAPVFKVFKGTAGGLEYKITYADIPFRPANYKEAEEALGKRCSALKTGFKVQVDKDEADNSLDNFPGRFLEISTPGLLRRIKVFVVNDRIYELTVQGKPQLVNESKDAPEFFSSFALEPVPARDTGIKQKEDFKQLEGTWRITTYEVDGQAEKADKAPKEFKIVDERLTGIILMEPEMSIRIEPTRTPKWLDLTFQKADKEITLRAIYDIEGDNLRISLPVVREGMEILKERPDNFEITSSAVANIKAARVK